VIGGALGFAARWYRKLRDARLRKQRELRSAFIDFKNRHDTRASNITRKNTRRAYERVYSDDALLGEYLAPERVEFYREVAEACAAWRPRSVIDVGCGTGNLLHAIVERTSPGRVVGVDHARAGIARARQLVPSGEFQVVDLKKLNLNETFELVLCTEVLEHLADPEEAVRVLVRLCADTGAIVVTVPDGAEDTWEGHRNFWTESELQEFLTPYGTVEVRRMRRAGSSLIALIRPRSGEGKVVEERVSLPSGA
jgi:2-polyprenyl-3-methyl-5-hydroxy-6-metoxy-1,4-benzoquinol methylase